MNSKKESNDQNGMQNKNQNHQPFERKQTNLEDLFGFGFEEEAKRFFEQNETVVDEEQTDRNTFERRKKEEDEILFEPYEENKDSEEESDEHKEGNQEEILFEPYDEKVENTDELGDERQNQEEEILFEPYEEEFEATDKGENWKERIANFMAPKGKKEQRDQAGINRQILKVAYLFAGLFLGLMIYIGYFVEIDSKDVITNPRNQRQDMLAKSVVRGNIESIDGEVLAKTEVDEDGNETRVYPFEHLYAHVVGYTIKGKSGLESTENFSLLSSHANIVERFFHTLQNKKSQGDTVVTTLNSKVQQAAYDALGDRKGAVVAMDPSTGKILAMVSKPGFDPNDLSEDWEFINSEEEQENARLLNRATQGIYPPGSTFKIVTTLAYLRQNPNYSNYQYTCEGEGIFNTVPIECYNKHVHGQENLVDSFANSCNTSFANIGTQLDKGKFYDLCESLFFNKSLSLDFTYKKSRFVLNEKSPDKQVAQTAIGQGDTGITPLHNLMITAAVANGGVMMKPYLVDHIENYTGGIVKKNTGKSYGSVMTADEASVLTDMMKEVVKRGTGTGLSGKSYSVAGKTGTAEFEEGKAAHAWFTGFAPADNPEIAVCVIVENSGAGSTYAVPVASKVFDAYFNSK